MAPREIHARSARWLHRLAEEALARQAIPAADLAFRCFEEIVDAEAARSALHFHDDYPQEAWTRRLSWLQAAEPELERVLQSLLNAAVWLVATGHHAPLQGLLPDLGRRIERLSA